MEGLGFIDVATFLGQSLVLEDCHSGMHTLEAKLLVERFFTWYRVQDDFLVPSRQAQQLGSDLLAQASALVVG